MNENNSGNPVKKIFNIAHRGFSGRFPENTMLAFEQAVELGVDMIEFDVHLTKDRRVVVHHDPELGRTVPGTGPIKDHDWDFLKTLDAGSSFDPQFRDQRIPLLEEVLEKIGGKTMLNIEIKGEAFEPEAPADCIERQVCQMVTHHQLEDSVVISSFEMESLRRCKTMAKAIPLGLLDMGDDKKLDLIDEIGPVSYHAYCERLCLEDVKIASQADLLTHVFTVNARDDMKTMIAMGVDGIITNFPDVLKQLIQDHNEAH